MRIGHNIIISWLIAASCLSFTLPGCASERQSGAKPLSLKLGYFNGPAATCASATPCQEVKPELKTEYYSYLEDKYVSLKKNLERDTPEVFQNGLLDYYDGLAARDKLFGPCYGRCTNYDQPEMMWHATTETARNMKLDALIDTRYVFYGAEKLMRNGIDVTDQIKSGLIKYRR